MGEKSFRLEFLVGQKLLIWLPLIRMVTGKSHGESRSHTGGYRIEQEASIMHLLFASTPEALPTGY